MKFPGAHFFCRSPPGPGRLFTAGPRRGSLVFLGKAYPLQAEQVRAAGQREPEKQHLDGQIHIIDDGSVAERAAGTEDQVRVGIDNLLFGQRSVLTMTRSAAGDIGGFRSRTRTSYSLSASVSSREG